MAVDNNLNQNPEITVTTVARDKSGRFVSVKKPDQLKSELNLEASLKEVLKYLVDNQKATLNLYNSQSEKTDKTNDHLNNLEKYFGQLTSFFAKQDEETEKENINDSFQKLNSQHLKNILIVDQKQLRELEMLNEQFIDFFEMNEKNIQDQKEQTIEREKEAAAPAPSTTNQQPKPEATGDNKKTGGIFSGFGSIVKNTFGALSGIGKGIFKGLGTIFSTLFSLVSAPFKFIGSALGSILSFIPGFGIISKLIPSINIGMGGLLSTLGVGALGYVGFKYLTDDKYKTGVDKYMGGITKFFSPFINAIKGFFDTPIGQAISSFVGDLWKTNIQPALKTTWEAIKTGIDDFGKTFLGEENWGQLKKSFASIEKWITNLPKSYEELSRSVKIMANSIIEGFNYLIIYLKSIPILGRIAPREILNVPFPQVDSENYLKTPSSGINTKEEIKNQDISKINLPSDINDAIDKKFSPQDTLAVKQLVKSESGGINQENSKTHDAGFFQFAPTTAWELLGRPNINGIKTVNGRYEFSDEAKIELSKIIRSLTAEQQTDLYLKYINPLTRTNTPLTFENLKAYGFASGKIPEAMKSGDLNYKIYGKDYGKEHQHFRQMQELSGGEGITYGGMLEWIRRTYLDKQPEESKQTPTGLPPKFGGIVSDVSLQLKQPLNESQKQKNINDVLNRARDDEARYGSEFANWFQLKPGEREVGPISKKLPRASKFVRNLATGATWLSAQLYRLIDDPSNPSVFDNPIVQPINEEITADRIKRIGQTHADYVFGTTGSYKPPPNNFAFGGASPTTVTNITNIHSTTSPKSSTFGDRINKTP